MSMKIVYTHTARQDLREIYDYIAFTLLVPGTAKSLTEKIMADIRSLEEFPESYPVYKDEPWHSQGVRFFPVKSYLVFYTVRHETETVSIARIIYGGRDISAQLEETVN
ncbi:MAG: type II toxin-antitoxin system RelE/ParE family toxin [Oscillospiraceae bacterium]|nr:type II toxin-antitoxin system RelE/ParE family toxin [Oscillospiraceae bacterium]